MSFAVATDIVSLKTFVLGLLRLELHPIPSDAILIVHLVLVGTLLVVFPFSKLLHAPGIFFSPTRNQVDDPRERRHITPWSTERLSGHRAGGAGD